MQSKDLRIGNYIYDSAKNKHRITSINDLELGLGVHSITFRFAEHIPLTEEWLLNFGFTKSDGYIVGSETVPFYYFEDLEYNLKSGECMFENFTVNLDKVHELQNLYFALYSEELELKHESKP
jgi:hypothetical protein